MTPIVAVAAVVLVLDQLTKLVALRRLELGIPQPVIDGFFSLTLVMNPGLAFGMLGRTPPAWRWAIAALSVVALVALLSFARRMAPAGGVLSALALGLILGGAVGNLIDRARFGAVVDFLDFFWRDYHWPAFNVADSGITVGVTLLAVRMVFPTREPDAG
jgi:signal peptidase II